MNNTENTKSSSKLIDIMYLTNPRNLNKIKGSGRKNDYSKEELKKNKKLIMKITENILKGEYTDNSQDVTSSFFDYYDKILEHEILKKKVNIIQSQYTVEKEKKVKKKVIELNVTDIDVNLLAKKEKKEKKTNLNNYLKKKKRKTKVKIHLPKKQNFS